ncbi:MAG TPA: tagaturonate epimerase family protein [Anaerolineae bacterium]
MSDLKSLNLNLHPRSLIAIGEIECGFEQNAAGAHVALLAPKGAALFRDFTGETSEHAGKTLLLGPTNPRNAAALRSHIPWLTPRPLGLHTSAGMGDRLGWATPGHVRAVRAANGTGSNKIAPIFAQQSIREMTRTGRTPQQVMDDATWGIFAEGWREGVGADADHLKVPGDIDACVAAGFSFYTIDPGEHVDNSAETASVADLRRAVDQLPWDRLEDSAQDMTTRYVGRVFDVEGYAIRFDEQILLRAAAKYGKAVAHVTAMYRHLAAKGIPFELEVSVDETELPTSHAEHVFIASELRRLNVKWVSLAPRYIGRFEKGVDYIGDLPAFEKDFAVHAAIARVLGPYKLSLHSGSDKFSIYPACARLTRGVVHLKTAGTSYLEGLHTIAAVDPAFFRSIYVFGLERWETDRVSYHVSAELSRAPAPASVKDADLPALLDQFDAREILHVTFGSVLTTRNADGRLRFYDRFAELLRANPEAYAANLERHFLRHLQPFASI